MDFFEGFIVIMAITIPSTTAHYGQETVVLVTEPLAYIRPQNIIVPMIYDKANIRTMEAKAVVKGSSAQGTVSFYQPHIGAPMFIVGRVTGLPNGGRHNVFITEFGDTEPSCTRCGPVWNTNFDGVYDYGFPLNKPLGDLGSITPGNDTTAFEIRTSHNFISLVPGHSTNILGRGLIVVTVSTTTAASVIVACGPIFSAQPMRDHAETNPKVKEK